MFKDQITTDEAKRRLSDIGNRCLQSGFYMCQTAEISSGLVEDSQSSQFTGRPGTAMLNQRLGIEFKPVMDFIGKFDADTLLIFNGSNSADVMKVWDFVGQTVQYEAIDFAVMDSEHGMFDAALREHMYFVGFPNVDQKRIFVLGYAGQDVDMLIHAADAAKP